MEKKSIRNNIFLPLLSLGALVFIDRWTKALAVTHLAGKEDVILIPGVLQLHYLENTGAAFSILENKMLFFYLLTPLLCFLLLYAYVRIPKSTRFFCIHAILLCLIAGAIGNYIDRIQNQYVIDFIYFSLINFPVFNVADIYVTCSVILLILLILFYYSDEEIEVLSKAIWQKRERKNNG